jgi:hypothetical protein
MPSEECPKCQMPVAGAMGKKYCPYCGWNRNEAEKQSRLLLKLLPALVILFDAPLIVWIFIGHAELPVLAVLGVLAIVPAILVRLVVTGKVRIGAAGTTPQEATGSTASARDDLTESYRILAELPPPRPIRLSRSGKMNITILAVALVLFAGVLVTVAVLQPPAARRNLGPANLIGYVLPVILLAGITFAMQRAILQQRHLLGEGAMAMARVTKQWTARNGHGIRYEFSTPTGEKFSRMTVDSQRRVFTGMDTPVFYDAQQPKKQVALCASLYEVILPGQG